MGVAGGSDKVPPSWVGQQWSAALSSAAPLLGVNIPSATTAGIAPRAFVPNMVKSVDVNDMLTKLVTSEKVREFYICCKKNL